MSRREEWKKLQDDMSSGVPASLEEMESVPDIACGTCKNFSENAYGSDGRGSCCVLKTGSDIAVNPSVEILSGENGYISFFNKNAEHCTHYSKLKLIDTDGHECADPAYRRAQRQMANELKRG